MPKKIKPDADGELKRLAEEFHQMESAEGLRSVSEAAGAKVMEEMARAQGAVPKRTVIIGITLASLVIIIAGFIFLGQLTHQEKIVSVPNIIGERLENAKNKLLNAGLHVNVSYDNRNQGTPGQVTFQNPAAGTKKKLDSVVTIMVAGDAPTPGNATTNAAGAGDTAGNTTADGAATENVVVPDIEGMVDSKAYSKLQALGLKVETTIVSDPSQPERIVMASDPKPDTTVAKGSTVKLSINAVKAAAGEQNTTSAQPLFISDYTGKISKDAISDLQNNGFTVEWQTEASQAQASGCVTRTIPPAGSQVVSGSKVTVVIAQ
jgi:serine/threonine-protein kinase